MNRDQRSPNRRTALGRLSLLLVMMLLLPACRSGDEPDPVQPVTEPAPGPVVVAPAPEPDADPDPEAAAEPVPLDGPLWLMPEIAHPDWDGPVAVVIENSAAARPQSGLQSADITIEHLAEGEVTRTLNLFWSEVPAEIGPVRSARAYTIRLANAYRAPYVHVGGSMESWALLDEPTTKDIDELRGSGAYFWRSRERPMPHNVYTSNQLLAGAVAARGYALEPVPATPRAPLSFPKEGGVRSVRVTWHSLHEVTWEWRDGAYYRSIAEYGGERVPHRDTSGTIIHQPNLVFLHVAGEYRGEEHGWSLDLASGGTGTVIAAGHSWEAEWAVVDGGIRLTPAPGEDAFPFAPGGVWVHLLTDWSDFVQNP